MAVNLGIGQRNMKSGIQGNRRTARIPTGPSRTVGVANDPGVAGGPSSIPAGAFGPDGNVDAGRQIQAGANTIIADEIRAQQAFAAAEQRELAKTETILLENTTNAFDATIKTLDTHKINAGDINRLAKADAMFQQPFAESMKIAEGRGEHFKERLRLKLDSKKDSQLGALNATWTTQQENTFVGLWQGEVGMLSSRAGGTTLIPDLIETEKISFKYRDGMGIDRWEKIRLEEMKKVTTSHLKALRRRFPFEKAREEYDRLLGDPIVQGILQEDLQTEIDDMVAVEKAAKDRENSDPIVQAQKEVKAVTEAYQKENPGKPLPFLQEAAILSKRFAPTPSQTEKSEQEVKVEHFNFLKKQLNIARIANNRPVLTPEQESELFLKGTVSPSLEEASKNLSKESRLKEGRTEVDKDEINRRRILNGLDPMTADQEQEFDLTGKFTKSIKEQSQDKDETATLKTERINKSRADQGLPPLSSEQAAKEETGVETPGEEGASQGTKDLNEIATLLNKNVEDLTAAERKLKLPKGMTINTPFESGFSKKAGTALADRLEKHVELASLGQQGNLQLDSITKALKTNAFDPGILPDTRIFLSTAATFVQDKLGIDMSAVTNFLGSAAAGNQLDAAGKRLLLQLAKGVGRITNLSLRFAEDAVPGIFRTREGLEIISALMKRENDINIGIGKIADEALGMEPSKARKFFRDTETAYRQANPLFNRDLQDKMLSIANKNRKKGSKKFTRADMFAKAPKKPGMTYRGTESGFHWYKDDKTGADFKMSIHGEDALDDPVGKVTPPPTSKPEEQAAVQQNSGATNVANALSNVSLDQVQSVVTDLIPDIDQKDLKNVMQGLQDLFTGGE